MADGISIRAENLQFDGKSFTSAMNEDMYNLFIEATRAFLIAATRRIPIRTGFLRGAFTRLEDVVGAYETSSSGKFNASGVHKPRSGPRPGKDLASTANRLVRLRQRQNTVLKQIRKLQQREAGRREVLNKRIQEIQQGNKGKFLADRKLRGVLAANRAVAIRQRNMVQSLIRQAKANDANIRKAVQVFREKLDGSLRSEANDTLRSLRLQDAILQQKRNEAFQRDLKKLNQGFFGKKDTTPGKVGGRVPGNLDQQTFDKRLSKLREKIGRPSSTQKRIRQRLKDIQGNFVTKEQQTRLENFARHLAKKYGDRIREAQQRDNDALETDLRNELSRKLQRARKKISNVNREDHPLLAAAQRRLARAQKLSEAHLEHLRLQLNSGGEHLNILARTTRGRIVGQNSPGKFNLQGSERVKKIFNSRDKEGGLVNQRQEFYYPTKGVKILKTPRAGRRFATPANAIIVKTTIPPKGTNPQLFRQLAGFLGAAGKEVPSFVQQAMRETSETVTDYTFNFAVDIRYLSVNDARLAWESWQAGVTAFSYVINTKAPARLPKLTDFNYVVVRAIKPGQSRPTVQTRNISGRK